MSRRPKLAAVPTAAEKPETIEVTAHHIVSVLAEIVRDLDGLHHDLRYLAGQTDEEVLTDGEDVLRVIAHGHRIENSVGELIGMLPAAARADVRKRAREIEDRRAP